MKRLIGTLAVFLLLFTLYIPQSVQAASTTARVTYKGLTTDYPKRKNYIYINGVKKNLYKTPVFLKTGAYVGPIAKIFVNSSINAGCKKSGNTITLTYKNKSLTMQDSSIDVLVNGKKEADALGAIAMKAVYYDGLTSGKWVGPLKSICKRLGLNYKISNGIIYISEPSDSSSSTTTASSSSSSDTEKISSVSNSSGKKVVLVLDPGHGGLDSGAIGKLYKEKNMNLAIVLAAKKYFDKDARFKVLYTRTTDLYPSLDARWKLANKNDADIFISVHINAASSSATGTETLYNNSRLSSTRKNGINSRQLAMAMQIAAVESTGFTNRGLVNRTGLRVLNKTSMPACLIEYGFISNRTEERIMHVHLNQYGRDLYLAIVDFMKKNGKI